MARRSRIKSRLITSICLMGLTLFGAVGASAQFGGIVFDPKNYIQNLYSASRTLVGIRQQVTQLQNEARMLVGQAKDLSRLDFNAQSELMGILDEITRLNHEAETLAYTVDQTRQLLSEDFPEDYSNLSKADQAVKARRQWELAREGYQAAMLMQSGLIESLARDRQTLERLMSESQSSSGNLSATQSTNQLLALLIKQNMAWQQMQVAGQRASALSEARLIAIEEESRAKRKNFIGEADIYRRSNR